MSENNIRDEPSWDAKLTVTLTPSAIMNTVFASADGVHTGWGSCIDEALVAAETTVVDERGANHCRLTEQEYGDREAPDDTWHEWSVELRIGEVYVIAHWRVRVSGSRADWDRCEAEAEAAFVQTCSLLGKRVTRALVIEEPSEPPRASRTRH